MAELEDSGKVIDSPHALEAIKELFHKHASFYCEPVLNAEGLYTGWRITIYDEGRSYSDDSNGQPMGTFNEDHAARVLAARTSDVVNVDSPFNTLRPESQDE